ncbi:MAG: hypothetical protein R3B70_17925 [Polyangiaceae bacterium]
MIRRLVATAGGLLSGLLLAIAVTPWSGVDAISGRPSNALVALSSAAALGALVASLASTGDLRKRGRHAVAGASLAVLTVYLLRNLPLPWLNLLALDGTAGLAGQLPLFSLPLVGLLAGWIFGARAPTPARP